MVAPLDWGLGHATRCIPLIRHLLDAGCDVIIASDGKQQAVLQEEFHSVRFARLPGYRLKYGKNRWNTIVKIILQIPKILISINRENHWVARYLHQNHVDALISDSRWGFYSSLIPSVFITHQLTIKTPFNDFIENVVRKMNYRLIEKFTECWVPDYEEADNLAGELSHPVIKPSIPVKYLGKLTRIVKETRPAGQNELLVIISGPEPQRSLFESMLFKQLVRTNSRAMLVRGLPGATQKLSSDNKNLIIYNHLSSEGLNKAINDSTIIISRSGYSTIMDLIAMNKKIIFVPTPGQSEQEYLARHLHQKKWCMHFSQAGFSLESVLQEVKQFAPAPFHAPASTEFKEITDRFIAAISSGIKPGCQ